MKSPDRDTTLEALKWFAHATDNELVDDGFEPVLNTMEMAAEAWAQIAPNADGEWPDEVVTRLGDALHAEMEHYGYAAGKFEMRIAAHDTVARAVLAEIVRLAEGGDDAD